MQTYSEYLATMKAYNFYPLDRATWQEWQDYYASKRNPRQESSRDRMD